MVRQILTRACAAVFTAAAMLPICAQAQDTLVIIEEGNSNLNTFQNSPNFDIFLFDLNADPPRTLQDGFDRAVNFGFFDVILVGRDGGLAYPQGVMLDGAFLSVEGFPFDSPDQVLVDSGTAAAAFDIFNGADVTLQGLTMSSINRGATITATPEGDPPFNVPVPTATAFPSTAPGGPVDISGAPTDPVRDINIQLTIENFDPSLLEVTLTAPDGTTMVTLIPAGSFETTTTTTWTNVTLDAEGGPRVNDNPDDAAIMDGERRRPAVPSLGQLNGQDRNGTWNLNVAGGGVLQDWSIIFPGEVGFDAVPEDPALDIDLAAVAGGTLTIGELELGLFLEHPETVSFLEVFLVNEAITGKRVRIVGGAGGDTALSIGEDSDTLALFRDSGARISESFPPFTSRPIRPSGSLATFTGETIDPGDDWRLQILNSSTTAEGALQQWQIANTDVSLGANVVRADNSNVIIEDSVIRESENSGARAVNQANLTVVRTLVERTGLLPGGAMDPSAALFAMNMNTQLTVSNTTIVNNPTRGILLQDEANAGIYFTTIMDNAEEGLRAEDTNTTASITDSLVFRNGGVGISKDTNATINTNNNYVLDNSGGTAGIDETDGGGNYENLDGDANSVALFPTPPDDPDPLVTGLGFITTNNSPLVDVATTNALDNELFFFDVELDPRPIEIFTNDSDVGADELLPSFVVGGAVQWVFAEVIDRGQQVPQFIGIGPPGGITIEITVIGDDPVDEVFILPQGEITVTDDNIIEFQEQGVSGSRRSRWTNVDGIQTILVDDPGPMGQGEGVPSPGDVIADGHGAVMIDVAGDIIGDPMAMMTDFTDSGQIRGQALLGRHVVIDTTPPIMDIFTYIPPARGRDGFVDTSIVNDTLNPGGFVPGPNHPYPSVPSTLPGSATTWEPGDPSVFFPQDDGGIGFTDLTGQGRGARVFFNHASRSLIFPPPDPTDPANNLRTNVTVVFKDDVVRDESIGLTFAADGTPIPPPPLLATDIFFNEDRVRQPGGFTFDTLSGGAGIFAWMTGQDLQNAPEVWRLGQWRLTPDSDDLNPDTPVQLSPTTRSVDPLGVDPTLEGWDVNADQSDGNGTAVIPTDVQNEYTAIWDFFDGTFGTLSFDDEVRDDNRLHLGMQFVGVDQAGNETPTTEEESDPFKRLLDPLHYWWIIDTGVALSPNRAGTDVALDELSFNWRLDRGFNPGTVAQPQPFFTFRIFTSNDRNGVFLPIDDWSNWGPNRQATNDFFQSIQPQIADKWVLFWVAAIDEAGNVTPRPPNTELPFDDGGSPGTFSDDQIDFAAAGIQRDGGQGWQKFFVELIASPDTQLNAQFWWNRFDAPASDPRQLEPGGGESVAGRDLAVVPSPPLARQQGPLSRDLLRVEAVFGLTLIRDEGQNLSDIGIVWELTRATSLGTNITGPTIRGTARPRNGGNSLTLYFPADPLNLGQNDTADVFPRDFNQIDQVFNIDDNWPNQLYLEDRRFPTAIRQPITYVFRAFAWEDTDGDGLYDEATETIDPTPVSHVFTVVPEADVSAYIDPKQAPGDQPIKVTEPR